MTDDALDAQPVADTTDTPGAVTPVQSPAPAGQDVAVTADQGDADALDVLGLLDLDAEGDDGTEAAESDAAEQPTVRPIGPDDGASDEEIASWRSEHGIPDDASGYEPPVVDGIEWNQAALSPILEVAHKHNLPMQSVADALAEYGKQVQAQRAQIKQRDIANVRVARAALGEDGVAAARSAAKAMPAELRTLLSQARGPDGARIDNHPAILKLITTAYGQGRTPMTKELKTEMAEIDADMHRDVSSLHRPWKTTGMTAGERRLQIARELDAAAATQARHTADRDAGSDEERELLTMHQNDPQFFEFGRWRNSNISPAQRLYDLRQGRR
jgi:hypothetical protein